MADEDDEPTTDEVAEEIAAPEAHEFATAVTKKVALDALSIDNPELLAARLKEWLPEHFPERVTAAYWIVITKGMRRDKGVAVTIKKLPKDLQAEALIGEWSAGLGIFTREKFLKRFRSKVSVGVGPAIAYENPRKLEAFFGAKVRL